MSDFSIDAVHRKIKDGYQRSRLCGQGDFLLFEYYSFVTLTTLGFGDITPLTKVAKAFSVLEAVVGQLYLVVVAWFVGMLVARKSENTKK